MTYYVLGSEDTVLGFSLVGIQGSVVTRREDALRQFQYVIEKRSYGIIIITESVANLIRQEVDQYLFTQDFPLIVEIPGREGRDPNGKDLRTMVQEAIGISL